MPVSRRSFWRRTQTARGVLRADLVVIPPTPINAVIKASPRDCLLMVFAIAITIAKVCRCNSGYARWRQKIHGKNRQTGRSEHVSAATKPRAAMRFGIFLVAGGLVIGVVDDRVEAAGARGAERPLDGVRAIAGVSSACSRSGACRTPATTSSIPAGGNPQRRFL